MQRRPWPVIILTVIFLIIPVVNVLSCYVLLAQQVPFLHYLKCLSTLPENRFLFINMIAPSVVAGVALYSMKKWSYPIIFSSILWITFYTFEQFSSDISYSLMFFGIAVPTIVNMGYLLYLLLPSVRKFYYKVEVESEDLEPEVSDSLF